MSTVRVPVFSDNILERDETFDLTLNIPLSAGRGFRLGSRNTSLGVITDSTCKCNNGTCRLVCYELLISMFCSKFTDLSCLQLVYSHIFVLVICILIHILLSCMLIRLPICSWNIPYRYQVNSYVSCMHSCGYLIYVLTIA